MFKKKFTQTLAVMAVAVGLGVMSAGPASARAANGTGPASARAANGTGPASAQSASGMWRVTCGSRTDWVRMWTEYHGFPVCYAASTAGGWVYYGNNVTNTTWTTYGVCAGNNDLYVTYFYWSGSSWILVQNEHVGWGSCDDWSTNTLGGTVEVESLSVASR